MSSITHEQAAGAVKQARGAVDSASSVARESRVVAPFAGRVAAMQRDGQLLMNRTPTPTGSTGLSAACWLR